MIPGARCTPPIQPRPPGQNKHDRQEAGIGLTKGHCVYNNLKRNCHPISGERALKLHLTHPVSWPDMLTFQAPAVYSCARQRERSSSPARQLDADKVREDVPETSAASLLALSRVHGGSNVQAPCYHHRSARTCFGGCADCRARGSWCVGQRALEILPREPACLAAGSDPSAGWEKRLRHHRIFFVIGAKPFALTTAHRRQSGSTSRRAGWLGNFTALTGFV
jgi:hypothetical protein